MERVIEVKGIKKAFGDHEVLKGVDFAANKGEVTCIIGSSGSGKSTLLRCINLLETPDEGQILTTARISSPARSTCRATTPKSAWSFSSSTCSAIWMC